MYQQAISRHNPACVVVLLDRSESMERPWQDSGMSLAEGAALALNRLVFDLSSVSTKRQGEPMRHYFDIGVFGYGKCPRSGGEGVESALAGTAPDQPLVPLPQLFANPVGMQTRPSVDRGAAVRMPVWVMPVAGFRTPMCQAIAVAGQHVSDWAEAHPISFPPVVINITDGLVTDSPYDGADLAGWAKRLMSIETVDGPVLLLNIFLSAVAAPQVLFPSSDKGLPEPGRELFEISSRLAPKMIANARSSLIDVHDDARGLVLNANLSTLVKFLELGTRGQEFRDR